mmetsp:Transcript_43202/g.91884  ORF Transcript_43202/g.91884 Transcript_43202/m.91884 type:complete len:339 (-) Transcript_43202:350-1366(-)
MRQPFGLRFGGVLLFACTIILKCGNGGIVRTLLVDGDGDPTHDAPTSLDLTPLGNESIAKNVAVDGNGAPTSHRLHPEDIDGEQAYLHIFKPTAVTPLSGTAVVVCPGGSYRQLVMEGGPGDPTFGLPGEALAQWLPRHGVLACLLRYRLPAGRGDVPLADVQLAIRRVREGGLAAGDSRAIDPPTKVGVMGFSSGGHLAGSAATMFTGPVDRPDFAVLVYPVVTMSGGWRHEPSARNLLGANPSRADLERFSLELRVTANTPPAFLAHAVDDKVVPVQNSRRFAAACWEHDVNSQLLELSDGGHGLNGYKGPNWEAWQVQALRWMRNVVNGRPVKVL